MGILPFVVVVLASATVFLCPRLALARLLALASVACAADLRPSDSTVVLAVLIAVLIPVLAVSILLLIIAHEALQLFVRGCCLVVVAICDSRRVHRAEISEVPSDRGSKIRSSSLGSLLGISHPPLSGWHACHSIGVMPPPTLTPIGALFPPGGEWQTLEHQLAYWFICNAVFDLLLCDDARYRGKISSFGIPL
jgi:hypothetical protein